MSQRKEVRHCSDGYMSITGGGGNRYGGAFLKGNDSWRPKHQRNRYNVQLLSHDPADGSRSLKCRSKRAAKAALLNWCRS
jgi:hypothetical protein